MSHSPLVPRVSDAAGSSRTTSIGGSTKRRRASRSRARVRRLELPPERRGKRRQYVREYLRWLRPHRYAVAGVFAVALVAAGLQMIGPLFMRHIIDRVLLDRTLTAAERLTRLNPAGALFVTVIVVANLVNMTKDYRSRSSD